MRVIASAAATIAIAAAGAASSGPIRAQNVGSAIAVTSAEKCAVVGGLALPDLATIEAELVPAGAFDLPASGRAPARSVDLPAFCRVRGVVSPEIRFEVWLPEAAAWNGRFEAVGGGGFAGVISYAAMAPALRDGYATASTDTGHTAPGVEWLADSRKLRDYGYRAIYEMTAKAKAAINAFYSRAPDYSYFNGCSTGGRQGLMEAQRFPGDYDGIVSGAPVNYFVATHYTQLWTALAVKPVDDESILSTADLKLVNETVLAQCDELDGVSDGVIENPLQCRFDPQVLQCSGSGAGQCLLADQVRALQQIYSGPVGPAGERLHPGLAPGGEPTWSLVTDSGLANIPQEYFSRSVFDDLGWDWRTFDFADDIALTEEKTGEVLNATDPDLTGFRDSGGKLILYHGWNDQLIQPENTINYYSGVLDTMGDDQDDWMRLFMVPGMNHCRGGYGPNQVDWLSSLERWRESGTAPDAITAYRVRGNTVDMTRPICAYPRVATWSGVGSINDAENFTCELP